MIRPKLSFEGTRPFSLSLIAALSIAALAGCGARTALFDEWEHGGPRDAGSDDADTDDADTDTDDADTDTNDADTNDADTDDADTNDADADPDDADVLPVDLREALESIEGMTVREQSIPGAARYFELWFVQPVDHDDPSRGTFEQFLTLVHRDRTAPLVLLSTGYDNYVHDYEVELTAMLRANQLTVEHRYFAGSRPEPVDWRFLTIEQAAADHHRIVEALRGIYTGAWISTGASKGGMTSIYHRRFYPDDVDGTVAYVAPISFGAPDARYIDFLAGVGTADCRDALRAVQIEALLRRPAMLDLCRELADTWGLTFDLSGGLAGAFEATVSDLPFLFWQYAGVEECGAVPRSGASDQELFDFLELYGGFSSNNDEGLLPFAPYYYQAETQLGYPDIDVSHIEHMLVEEGFDLARILPGVPIEYDPEAMLDIAGWVETDATELMFIYGEWDPWTGGAFRIAPDADQHLFTVAQGTHMSQIGDLDWAQRDRAFAVLRRWTGVYPSSRPSPRPLPRPLRRRHVGLRLVP